MLFYLIVAVVLWYLFGDKIKAKAQPILDKTDVDEKLVAIIQGEGGEVIKRLADVAAAFKTIRASTDCPDCKARLDELQPKVTLEVSKQ